MNAKTKDTLQPDSNALSKRFYPVICDIYDTFSYVAISKEEIYQFFIKELSKEKNKDLEDQELIERMKTKIELQFEQKVHQMLHDSKKSLSLLSNYVNQKFQEPKNYEEAITYLNDFDSFLKSYEYLPDLNTSIDLIQGNPLFSQIVQFIFMEDREQILMGNAQKIYKNDFYVCVMEAYCILHDIEIETIQDAPEARIFLEDSDRFYLSEIGKHPLLSEEKEKKLLQRIAEGDSEARKEFIESNLRLVVSVAKKYLNRGLDFLDLVQEGNMGLMEATERYDIERGYRFSTYATYWIRLFISKAIANKGRNVRIPIHAYEKLRKYRKTVDNLEGKMNGESTMDDVANEMGLSRTAVSRLDKLQTDTVSINSLIDDKEETELGYFIASDDESPENLAIASTLPDQVKKLFEQCKLRPREIDILTARYGLNGNEPCTLKEVGEMFHLTRERVRQIEAKSFMKIRRSKYVKELADYTEFPEKALANIQTFREKYADSQNKGAYHFKKYNRELEKEKDEKMPKKIQSIYEYFINYTREQINTAIANLTEEEQDLLRIRYGKDLDHPEKTTLTKEQKNRFYGYLMPKIKRMLISLTRGEPLKQEETKQIPASVVEKTKESSPMVIEEKQEEVPSPSEKEMTKEDYRKILSLLKTPTFTQLMSTLSVKDAVIIALKLGYIDDKYFSTEAIAKFLEIEPSEVIETTKKVLLVYKDGFNQFIDQAISVTTDEVHQNQKRR